MLKSENQKYISELERLKKACQIAKKEKDKYIEELSKIDRTATEQKFNFEIVFKMSEYIHLVLVPITESRSCSALSAFG